jgi:Ran GTPase-activating protein (RanGAP) involved in mRNA processing and transport
MSVVLDTLAERLALLQRYEARFGPLKDDESDDDEDEDENDADDQTSTSAPARQRPTYSDLASQSGSDVVTPDSVSDRTLN